MPFKQQRKIVRIGKTNLAAILPRGWLRFYELEAGDRVEVISNGKVTVRPAGKDRSISSGREAE